MRIPFPSIKYPLVAILRGLKPEETHDVVSVLIETGFRAIEIPLNSPEPFKSIEIAAKLAPADCLIGAGTVLTVDDVQNLDKAGGKLMVSPNVDVEVITAAREKGMVTLPGVLTPTEALLAAKDFSDYTKAGITAFGLGTSLYKPGLTAAEVKERAILTINAYDAAIKEA